MPTSRLQSCTLFLSVVLALVICASLPIVSTTAPAKKQQDPPQDQDDVVRVSTDLVVLNVTVLDAGGKFVTRLKRNDFQIIEDGVEQKIAAFSAEETAFAAAILLDTSGSMESRLTLGRSAALRFLDGLREQDVASVYSFDIKVEQWSDFSPGRDLPPRVYLLKTKTMTALNDAVFRAADDLAKREEKRRAILVLSDGGENFSRISAEKALDRAADAAVTIYGVNMSEQGPKRNIAAAATLKNLAEKSGGRYIDVPGGVLLRDSFAEIAQELGNQYTISYRPTNRARDGKWRKVEVKLTKPDVTVRTRKGYRAPKG